MREDDVSVFWELMFLRFHGLHAKDSAGLFGELLAARYGYPAKDLPPAMDNLLARLESAEQRARATAENQPLQPLLLACEIVEAVEKAASTCAPLNLEAAAKAILARHPDSGATQSEVIEVLREEAVAAGVHLPEAAYV